MKRLIIAIILLGSVVAGYGMKFHYISDIDDGGKLYPTHGVVNIIKGAVFITIGDDFIELKILDTQWVQNYQVHHCVDQYGVESLILVGEEHRVFWKTKKFFIEFVRKW